MVAWPWGVTVEMGRCHWVVLGGALELPGLTDGKNVVERISSSMKFSPKVSYDFEVEKI